MQDHIAFFSNRDEVRVVTRLRSGCTRFGLLGRTSRNYECDMVMSHVTVRLLGTHCGCFDLLAGTRVEIETRNLKGTFAFYCLLPYCSLFFLSSLLK